MERLNEAEVTENEYYTGVSRKLRNAKYISLLAMVVCALLTLYAYRDRLTYGNLRYLLRDMDAAGNASVSGETVYYTADDKNTFIYFRDDLAVGSSSGVTFHRAFGGRSFYDEVNFKSPVLAGSKKYMLAYDTGGSSFYVYNSLGRVYSEKIDGTVISAAAAPYGSFAVLTKNKKGGGDVTLYDKNFKKTATLTRAGNAYTIGFLGDGRLYICESTLKGSSLYSSVAFYTAGDSDTHGELEISGFALKAGSIKDGFYLLTDRSLAFYSDSGSETAYHSFGTADLLYAAADRNGVSVLLKENTSGEELGAYRYVGGAVTSYPLEKGAKGLAVTNGKACVLYDGRLDVLGGDKVTSLEIPSGARAVVAAATGDVIVCYGDYAKIISVR